MRSHVLKGIVWPRLALLCFAELYFATGQAAAQQGTGQEKPASVEGTVVNSITGEPLAHAHVMLTGSANPAPKTYGALSGADGKFSIISMVPGTYTVLAARVEFVTSRADPVKLSPGDARTDVLVKLIPTGAITGRVVDAEGEPMEGVRVSASINDDDAANATTDQKGEFRIGGLAPAKYRVYAKPLAEDLPQEIRTDGTIEVHYRGTYFPGVPDTVSAARVDVAAGSETGGIEIHLLRVPIVNLSGKIQGIQKGAGEVWLLVQEGCLEANGDESTVGADGTFHLWRLDPGKYCVRASQGGRRSGMSSLPAEVYLTDKSIEYLQLALTPVSNISGQLEYDDGQAKAPPVQAANASANEITLRSVTLERATGPAKIAENGSFLLEDVPPDLYRIDISQAGVYVKSNLLGGVAADGSMLDLRNGVSGQMLSVRLSSAVAELSGTVSAGNDAAAGARVVLATDDPAPDGFHRIVNADATGGFRISGIPPGKYKLLALEPGRESPVVRGRLSEQYDAMAEPLELAPSDKATRELKLKLH